MNLRLPGSIELYLTADNGDDPNALDTCVSADATVVDEARTYRGLAAIKQWKIETRRKYGHTVQPLAAEQRGGATVVTTKVSGNFPGSPITLQFRFTLVGDKIQSLEIGA